MMMRNSSISVLISLCALVVAGCNDRPGGAAVTSKGTAPATNSGEPVSGSAKIQSLRAAEVGRFSGRSWELEIDGETRVGHLRVNSRPQVIERELHLSEEEMRRLREAVVQSRLFELPAEIGNAVPDGSTRTITVATENRQKAMVIRFIAPEKVDRDTRSALELWMVVRSIFEEPEAHDSRPFDVKLLGK